MSRLFIMSLILAGLLTANLTASAATGSGTATVSDDKAATDKIAVAMSGVSAPAPGTAYEGWVVSDNDSVKTSTGILRVSSGGVVNASYTSPTGENLFGRYNKFVVTVEPSPDRDPAPSGVIAYKDELPSGVILHIRHLLSKWDSAPNQTGLAVGTRSQSWLVRTHAGFLIAEARAGNLAGVKSHAEHLVNMIEGAKGPHYGDVNKNGRVENPGDGYGLLVYAELASVHAGLAAASPGASATTKLHSTHVIASTESIRAWTPRIRDIALQIAVASSVNEAIPFVDELDLLGNATYSGVDANGNGRIELIKGEAGAEITYVHSQLMGIYNLAGDGTPPPAVVPGALPLTGDDVLPLAALLVVAGLAAIALGRRFQQHARRQA